MDVSSQWATQAVTPTTANDKTSVTIINTPVTKVEGTKTWQTTLTHSDKPILKLTRTWDGNLNGDETVKGSGVAHNVYDMTSQYDLQPVWTGSGNALTYNYSNLPKYNSDGKEYKYSVTEASFTIGDGADKVTYTIQDGLATTTDEDATEFVYVEGDPDATGGRDIYNIEATVVSVEKNWNVYGLKDEDLSDSTKPSDDKIQSITYKLTRRFQFDGTSEPEDEVEDVEEVTLTKNDDDGLIYVGDSSKTEQNWNYSWNNIELYGYKPKSGSGTGTDIGEGGYNGFYVYTAKEIAFKYNNVEYTVDGTTVKKKADGSVTDEWLVNLQPGNNSFTYTNTLNETPFEFTKQWRDGSSTSNKKWPTESGTELAITVKLQRRLRKDAENIAAGYVIDPTFTQTFSITPTTHDGWEMKTVFTAKADPSDTGNNTDPVYTFSKTGLKKHGSITIAEGGDAGTYTGDFEYFMTETSLDGYNTTYLIAIDGTPTGTKEDITTGEVIRNTVEMSFELPSTGGPGTTGFYVLGSILTLLALVLLITKKRSDGAGIE